MKKAFSIGISAALVLSLLTACNSKAVDDSSQPDAAPQEVVETAVQEPPAEPDNADVDAVEPVSQGEIISHDELIAEFEKAYNAFEADRLGVDDVDIPSELLRLEANVAGSGKQLPSDFETQYRNWRPTQSGVVQQENKDYFTSVNETVYATSTVNIRSEANANSDKVGSLAKGASVVRIGIGTEEFSGWSRVELSDGTVAYISSQYLSTTKPVVSSGGSGSGSGGSSSTSGGQSGSGGQSSTPEPGTSTTMPGYGSPEHEIHPTDIEDPWDTIYKVQ